MRDGGSRIRCARVAVARLRSILYTSRPAATGSRAYSGVIQCTAHRQAHAKKKTGGRPSMIAILRISATRGRSVEAEALL
jgi:hypothetical protein